MSYNRGVQLFVNFFGLLNGIYLLILPVNYRFNHSYFEVTIILSMYLLTYKLVYTKGCDLLVYNLFECLVNDNSNLALGKRFWDCFEFCMVQLSHIVIPIPCEQYFNVILRCIMLNVEWLRTWDISKIVLFQFGTILQFRLRAVARSFRRQTFGQQC